MSRYTDRSLGWDGYELASEMLTRLERVRYDEAVRHDVRWLTETKGQLEALKERLHYLDLSKRIKDAPAE